MGQRKYGRVREKENKKELNGGAKSAWKTALKGVGGKGKSFVKPLLRRKRKKKKQRRYGGLKKAAGQLRNFSVRTSHWRKNGELGQFFADCLRGLGTCGLLLDQEGS